MISYAQWSTVPAQYVAWQQDYEQVRRFLINTNVGMRAWLDDRWDEAVTEADRRFDPDVHDAGLVAEIFDSAVGSWPEDYFWQLSSAVIKDACTLFEVFLERLAHEVLSRHGAGLSTIGTEDSWRWPDCRDFYNAFLGLDVTPAPIDAILWMRNKMTHLRDSLRTGAGMADFTAHLTALAVDGPPTTDEAALGLFERGPYTRHGVVLSQLQTLRIIDKLGDHITRVALDVFPYTHGTAATPALTALARKTPLPSPLLKKLIVIRT